MLCVTDQTSVHGYSTNLRSLAIAQTDLLGMVALSL